jgi:hypothetical protein
MGNETVGAGQGPNYAQIMFNDLTTVKAKPLRAAALQITW